MQKLEKLESEISDCCLCELAQTRTNVVFGDGNPYSGVVFIGEAPGETEDLEGKPFVGRAGKLLTANLSKYNITRKDYYITNIVKCRPPNNRNPKTIEMATCIHWLNKQLTILKPKLVCLLGNISCGQILGTTGINNLRSKIFYSEIYSCLLIPIFHPSYVLRVKSKSELFEQDLGLISKLIKKIKEV